MKVCSDANWELAKAAVRGVVENEESAPGYDSLANLMCCWKRVDWSNAESYRLKGVHEIHHVGGV